MNAAASSLVDNLVAENRSVDGRNGFSAEPAAFSDWADLFTLLSDRTRLRILYHLSQADELHVGALCDLLEQRQPAVSHHLALLRDAGLVCSRRDGKHNFYRCIPERLDSVTDISWRDVMVSSGDDEMVSAPSAS
jgi:DNA-binding transcriptional ArsR family regulator